MPITLSPPLATLLERFLSYGTAKASFDDALIIRRARGFSLIGLSVIFLAGVVTTSLHGLYDIALGATVLMGFLVGAVALGFVQEARWLKPITHAGMGVMLAGIIDISVRIGGSNEISAMFSVLLIMVTSYVLGVRAALFWTLASIAGAGFAAYVAELPPDMVAAGTASRTGMFTIRAVVLLAVFALTAADRRFADRQSAELAYLARMDALTGLFGRRAFEERLRHGIARVHRYGHRLALVVIDLDGFKAVNDQHGHSAGDTVLRCVAARIAERTRATDSACRIGGDEFMILLQEAGNDKQIGLHVERLLRSIAEPIEFHGHDFRIAASAGVATFRVGIDDEEGLIHAADLAMYAAKASGGGQVCFHDEHRE